MPGIINDTQYLCLASMTLYTMYIFGIYDNKDKALMDYVLLPRRMLGRLLDVKVWRGRIV